MMSLRLSDLALVLGWLVFGALMFATAREVFRSYRLGGRPSRKRNGHTEQALDKAAAGRLRARMRRMAEPTLLLVPAAEPGFSKLGGKPELPPGQGWLPGDRGPREFLAQIDLGAFRPDAGPAWLPTHGRLYAFYDRDRRGFADVVRVLYTDEAPGPATDPGSPVKLYAERRVAFMEFSSVPSPDWLHIDLAELDIDFEDFERDLAEFVDEPPADGLQHRLGGYPVELQQECLRLLCEHLARGLPRPEWGIDVPPAIQGASKDWKLLLQTDSDPALKMNFGDGGRLYVFVREQHARAADFSKTVAVWQTH